MIALCIFDISEFQKLIKDCNQFLTLGKTVVLVNPCKRAAVLTRRWATLPRELPLKVDDVVIDAMDPDQVRPASDQLRNAEDA